MLRESKRLAGMPVISLEDGAMVGRVRSLVVDPAQKRVVALVLDQKGWLRDVKVISYESITSVGDHAVTVASAASVQKSNELPVVARWLKQPVRLTGARVLTAAGSELGSVDEFFLETETGEIAHLVINRRLLDNILKGLACLPIDAITTIGRSTVIARVGAEQDLIREEGRMLDAVGRVRDAGSQAWKSSVLTSRQWGKSLRGSLTRLATDKGIKKTSSRGDADTPVPTDGPQAPPPAAPPRAAEQPGTSPGHE